MKENGGKAAVYLLSDLLASAAFLSAVDVEHPKAGKITITGPHIKLSETKATVRTPSPGLGEHNEEILGALLNLSKEECEQLKAEGVL